MGRFRTYTTAVKNAEGKNEEVYFGRVWNELPDFLRCAYAGRMPSAGSREAYRRITGSLRGRKTPAEAKFGKYILTVSRS